MDPGLQPPSPKVDRLVAAREGIAGSEGVPLGRNALGIGGPLPTTRQEGMGAAVARKDRRARQFLAGADAAAALAALTITMSLLPGVSAKPTALLLLPVVILVNKLLGLYD